MMEPSLQNEENLVASDQNIDQVKFKSYDELIREQSVRHKGQRNSLFVFAVFFIGLILVSYYVYKKGLFSAIMPQWVRFNIVLYKDRKTGRLLLKFFVFNSTNESKTFMHPQVFFKRGKIRRFFRLKNDTFPLTLTPGTGHSIVIDIEQFWDKVPDLKGFNKVGAIIDTNQGITYRTFAYPRWFVFGKI